jgi:serine/threonine-protein kinase
MTPDRWRRIEVIFDRAVGIAVPDRPEHLRRVCGEDEALRAEVAALLRADQQPGAATFIGEVVFAALRDLRPVD